MWMLRWTQCLAIEADGSGYVIYVTAFVETGDKGQP
jgi:hypothetical protein